jgi:hemerythrin-like domain-containing protein
MNFYELLEEDHRNVENLIRRIDRSKTGSERREELFLELKREIELHSLLEETIVYPALENETGTSEMSLEAREEHRIIKMLLEEMEALDTDDEEWEAKFKVMRERIEEHVKEEEGEIFPAARKVISNEQAEDLGARIVTEKALRRASEPEPANKED